MAEAAVAAAGAGIAADEAKSAIATLIGQILHILRDLINWALKMFNKIVTYAGKHPEAMIQVVGLATIWMT